MQAVNQAFCNRRQYDLKRRKGNIKSPLVCMSKIFNKLPKDIKNKDIKPFKRELKKWLLEKEFYEIEEFWK